MTPSQKQRAIKILKPLIMEVKRELEEDTGEGLIRTTLDMIKTQIGLNLELDDYFSGIKKHKGKPYFNVVLKQRVSESDEYVKLESFAHKYKLIKVEPNGLRRVAIFPLSI